MEYQIHFERKFYKDKKTGYWISSDYTKERPRIRAHRWVWISVHKIIPKGYHIHHINNDKSDNRIDNLELIKGSRHLSHHMQDPERKRKAAENCERIRPLTKKWHASEEGRVWHKLHALKCKFGNGESFKYECQQCKKEYFSKLKAKGRTRFCSNKCKSKWRRDQGIDDIEDTCKKCGSIFKKNKYQKTTACGKLCAAKLRWEKRQK